MSKLTMGQQAAYDKLVSAGSVGHRASCTNATLSALERRGLAHWTPARRGEAWDTWYAGPAPAAKTLFETAQPYDPEANSTEDMEPRICKSDMIAWLQSRRKLTTADQAMVDAIVLQLKAH